MRKTGQKYGIILSLLHQGKSAINSTLSIWLTKPYNLRFLTAGVDYITDSIAKTSRH